MIPVICKYFVNSLVTFLSFVGHVHPRQLCVFRIVVLLSSAALLLKRSLLFNVIVLVLLLNLLGHNLILYSVICVRTFLIGFEILLIPESICCLSVS